MNDEELKKLKRVSARTLMAEDVVLLDLATDFSIAEIDDACRKALAAVKSISGPEAIIANSILLIGMSVVVRAVTERRMAAVRQEEQEPGDPGTGNQDV